MPFPLGGSQFLSDPTLVCLELKAVGERVMAHAIPVRRESIPSDPVPVCRELQAIGGTR